MGKFNFKETLKNDNVKRLIIFIVTFACIYVILMTSLVTKKYSLKEGEIAKVDIEAPREVKDRVSTQEKVSQAISQVSPQFNKKEEVKIKVIDEINQLFAQTIQLADSNIEDISKIEKIKSQSSINLNDEEYAKLVLLSKDELKTLQDFLVKTMSDLYDNNNIQDKNNQNSKEAQESIDKATNSLNISLNTFNSSSKHSKEIKELAESIAMKELKPNFFYDEEKTEELKKTAKDSVNNVIVKKGQIIVKKGEPATKAQVELLKDLGLLNTNKGINWYVYISLSVLVILILFLQWLYIYIYYYRDIFLDPSKLVLINLLTVISLLIARTLSIISPFLIPLACMPMLLTLIFDDKLSLNINIINCVLISFTVAFNVEITLLAILSSVLGTIMLKDMNQRNDIIYSAIYISVIISVMTFSVGMLLSNNIDEVAKKTGFAFIGGILSAVLTIGLLPFVENIFDIVTIMKLLELSNPNQPLLKELLIEAPGTYHHSILVANLAELAAEEVGGDVVLTRVSSYYHDIGKIKRPYFFKENQLGNDNPHDNITANLSTLIITSHVKDGIDMANEYKIPKVITDIIEQHHGTSLVKYFYVTAKNSSENPEDIKEEDFRYKGPIPASKEAGIIMLADCVEASVRSIKNPTQGKIEEMVNNIIKDRLYEGQLDECDLTLKDLDKIRKSFLKTLSGIYHKRIEYPIDKSENGE